jgi:hypothetical protein
MMGTHIIWRNPFPPRKGEFKLRRVAGDERATSYQVASPRNQQPFELVHGVPRPTKAVRKKAEPVAAPFGAELVLARW